MATENRMNNIYPGGGPFTTVLTLRGSDRTVSFSVNGVQQSGVAKQSSVYMDRGLFKSWSFRGAGDVVA